MKSIKFYKTFNIVKNFCSKINLKDDLLKISKINSIEENLTKTKEFSKINFCSNMIKEHDIELVQNLNKTNKQKIIKDLLEITKFKLSVLNSLVAMSTFSLCSTNFNFLEFFAFTLGTMTVSMTTQVLNQIKEKKFDSTMRRTFNRPLPKEKFTNKEAFIIASSLNISSIIFYSQLPMGLPTIITSNLILLMYTQLYTPLKRVNNSSMHIGAIIGALPAFLGSIGALGYIDYPSLLLGLYIFFWQYPHFYGILYPNKNDYQVAGYRFIASDDKKDINAWIQIIIGMIGMALSVYLMYKNEIISLPVISLFTLTYLYKIPAVWNFLTNTVKYGKIIRIRSYLPFLIILFSYFITAINKQIKISLNS